MHIAVGPGAAAAAVPRRAPGSPADRAKDLAVAGGRVEQQCGPDKWLVTIEDRCLAELDDDSPAAEATADEDLLFPQCYRDSSELRPAPRAGIEAGQ